MNEVAPRPETSTNVGDALELVMSHSYDSYATKTTWRIPVHVLEGTSVDRAVRRSLELGGRVLSGGNGPLDPDDVVPSVVLPADAPEGSHGLESHGAVQANARFVGQRHARHSGAVAALGQTGE